MRGRRFFSSVSIKKTMTYAFLALVISAVLAFLLVSLSSTSRAVIWNSIYHGQQMNQMINDQIDSYIEYMENISILVSEDEDVPRYLFYGLDEGEEREKILGNSNYSPVYDIDRESLQTRITDQFLTVMKARGDIANIGILYEDEAYIFNDGTDQINPNIKLEELEWIRQTRQSADGMSLSASHVQNLVLNDYRWVITLSRVIRNPYTNERQGLFFIDLNYDTISDLCEKNATGEHGYVFILDENGNIIYHPKQQLLYSGLMEERICEVLACKEGYFITEEKSLYTMSHSKKTGWTVVGVSYLDEMTKMRTQITYIFILTAAVLIGAAVIFSKLLAQRITLPILRLRESMREVERGNFAGANVEVSEQNEIGSLGNSFNLMTEKIEELMEQNVAEQREKRKIELRALQSQINPHFLYNTLDSIIWMAESGENAQVVKMTSSLAQLMRQSFNNKQEIVPLSSEIEHVKSYLMIQKMRYLDKLNFEIALEEGLENFSIVKLVLQPLAENAIYHGIRYKEGMGTIWIGARTIGDALEITLTDDGVGMDADTLCHIFDEHKVNYNSNGVGVYNVQRRLKLYYGSDYGLSYESAVGKGTRVTLRIPGERKK